MFLNQIILAGSNRAGQWCRDPACSSCRGVLDRPTSDVYRRIATIEKLHEIGVEACATVSPAAINLADYDRICLRNQRAGRESEAQDLAPQSRGGHRLNIAERCGC